MSMFFELPVPVFWLWFSALVYLVSIGLFWSSFRRERSQLMNAFMGFLVGMAWLHLFIGAGLYWGQMFLSHIGFLGGLTGVAYTLKFPLSALSESKRKPLFYLGLTSAWLIVGWMLLFPHKPSTMIWVGYIYMITVAGLISSIYIIWRGIKARNTWVKVKGIGGGIGIMSCCFLADILVLYVLVTGISMGVVTGHFFMWLAPIVLIAFVFFGRILEKRSSL